jgi:dUTP pyrophosphatase
MKTELFYGNIAPFYIDALAVRHAVFTLEQGFAAEIDADSIDPYAWHIVLYDEAKPVATARLYSNETEGAYCIGRVAVLAAYRTQQLGRALIDVLLQRAMIETKHRQVIVHAQVPVVPFYEKLGFKTTGEPFDEDGAPHILMGLRLAVRGFQVAKGFEHEPVVLPARKTAASAGYDLALIEATTIPPLTTVLAKTGLKAYMLPDEVLEIYIRSSIAVKRRVWCANNVGIIDADYYNNPDNDGHIMVPLYNANDEPVQFEQGERVAQAIFKKYLSIDDETADGFATRTGGFGSTGTN